MATPRGGIMGVSQVAIRSITKSVESFDGFVGEFLTMDMTKTLRIAFIVAILFPIIITQLGSVDTSGWNTTLVTIWTNLPIFIGLGVLFLFLKMGGLGGSNVKG